MTIPTVHAGSRSTRFGLRTLVKRSALTLLAASFIGCGSSTSFDAPLGSNPPVNPVSILATVPEDVSGGAPNATLRQSAIFAWQEFVALSWPAVPQTGELGTRDVPDTTRPFGDPTYSGPLVWETFRHKAEIFPASGDPHGFEKGAAEDFGYDEAPEYVYPEPQPTGTSTTTPWNNLDESTEIGLNSMFAGSGPTLPPPGQQFLYQAKANRTQYKYIAANGWYGDVAPPFNATAAFLKENRRNAPPGSSDLVSFPSGTIELKAAFRKLGPSEDASRYHTTTARHYEQVEGGGLAFEDSTFALVALHIIHKTPTAPYFVFATFEQVDNIRDEVGNSVEDAEGRLLRNADRTPYDPDITSKDAVAANPPTLESIQQLFPSVAQSVPGLRLFFTNTSGTRLPQGTVSVNRRVHSIPQAIIDINQSAHEAIAFYNQQNGIESSPWQFYKLVNVQARPIDKLAGQPLGSDDEAEYYLANSVVETDYNLQVFSGRFQQAGGTLTTDDVKDLITDFNIDGTPFKNIVFAGQHFNMGGCMGCHGNASVNGADSSFILLGGRVSDPDPVGVAPSESPRLDLLKGILHN